MKKDSILRALVERKFLQKVLKNLDNGISRLTVRIMSIFTPIQQDKIIFLTSRGSYDCNPKWICEEIVRRKLPYQLCWVYKEKALTGIEDFPSGVKLVRIETLDFFRDLCSARIIVDNGTSVGYQWYKKRKGQYLIQTWHGSLGIKKFSPDTVKDKYWVKRAMAEGKMTDACISNSAFEENEVYRPDYWKQAEIWNYGHARNDILFELDSERSQRIREKVEKTFNIDPETKVCLYAPTFRDDSNMAPYNINYKELADVLQRRFGGKWIILVRFHWKIWKELENIGVINYSDVRVIDTSFYPDIQELALCTDVALTDYSSWICEYLVTRRPGFLFATDLAAYQKKDREFFFPLDTLPFPVAENQRELTDKILAFDNEEYKRRCDEFLQAMGSVDDGHAAERAVNKIEEIMQGGGKV